MSFGRMSSFINILSNEPSKDAEGFAVNTDKPVASVRAYREERNGNEAWRNRSAFSTATTLFRFRRIPNVNVTTAMKIDCGGEQFNIISVEDVKGRGMYIEALCNTVTASEG